MPALFKNTPQCLTKVRTTINYDRSDRLCFGDCLHFHLPLSPRMRGPNGSVCGASGDFRLLL
jgi:hypothetical protein